MFAAPRLATRARRVSLLLPLACALALSAPRPASAQGGPPTKTSERRNGALLREFADLARRAGPAVVEVTSAAGDELGLATAIEEGRFLLTSRSILEGAPPGDLIVRTAAGRAAPAYVVGANEPYDVALLAPREDLAIPAAQIGRSRDLAIGAWVVTVGPRRVFPIAVGVVSALDRRVEARAEGQALDLFGLFSDGQGPRRAYAKVIQHDSPVDAGRHGGAPLLDAEGRLVGVNVATVYRGSSFATPIDEILSFLEDLKAGRSGPAFPRPGYLGVRLGPVEDDDLRAAHGIDAPGARVEALAPGHPAERSGIRVGDVILSIDGEKIRSPERVGHAIRSRPPGAVVKLRVLRAGRELEIAVTLVERPPE
jgi:S1-C subfamily serine protease